MITEQTFLTVDAALPPYEEIWLGESGGFLFLLLFAAAPLLLTVVSAIITIVIVRRTAKKPPADRGERKEDAREP